jgi:hypothetical protein
VVCNESEYCGKLNWVYLIALNSVSSQNNKFIKNIVLQVRYLLSFRSSNTTVMDHPRASIPTTGFVPRKTKGKSVTLWYLQERDTGVNHTC